MAFSPSRRVTANSYLHRKETYTYNRQQNINQANFSNFSPSIRSPKLNQQSQYTKLNHVGLVEELKTKLQTVLRHNSHLLNQNATLSEMVNNLKMELEIRTKREESQSMKINVEFTTIIEELRETIRIKQAEAVRLLDEVSRLHDQCYRIQVLKNTEIKEIAENHQKELALQIRNIKKTSDDSKELLELQIRKLKQSIELKNYEYQAIKSQSKTENDRLKAELEEAKSQIKHFNQLKQIQIREINQKYKQLMNTTTKHTERENTIAISKLQNKVKKLKQEVINKNIEIEQTTKKSVVNTEQCQLQVQNLQNQKQRLLEEINELEISNKENLQREKERTRELYELELKNLENIVQNEKDCLKSEINKLLTVCASKTEEIKRLYNNLNEIKAAHASDKRENQKLIEELRKRIKVLEEDSLEEIELLKIKMAQLHEADIKSLEQFYESQVALLQRQVRELQQQRDIDREKIHKCLQDNDLLRKTFETELTKYKAKVQDYKVKFAAANLEFREQITSLGTKMELTSQTLLRQTEQKQKGAQFYQAQKKKFHTLIQGKDKQIQTAYNTMNRLKQLHAEQVRQMRQQISSLRDNLTSKINQLRDLRIELQEQFERKSQKLIQDRKQSPNDILIRQNKELKDHIQILEKQVLAKTKEIEFLQKEVKSLQQEIGLRAGFLETMQLQSSAAIEDERSKFKIIMNENEVAMKDYYQAKLASKNKDIFGLQEQLHEKQNDIRQLIVKYNQLEKRLKELLQSQQRLSQFEKKIVNLGLDQNLVKNMSELFAKYRR